jgi:MoaA/NifB/PqqE/SkfB family radical SAM enzyme
MLANVPKRYIQVETLLIFQNLQKFNSLTEWPSRAVGGLFWFGEGSSLNAGGTLAEAVGAPLAAEPGAKIPSIDWWMTSHCNLACDFCFGPRPGRDPVELRGEILRALVSSSARAVTFCGGEPLLIRRIGQYSAALRRSGKSIVLNTNGQLLRRRLDQGLRLTDFNVVGISIDGPTAEVHRSMRGENADLDEVLKAARMVRYTSGVKLKFATVVSAVNRDGLPAMAKIIHRLRPDIWRLYQYSSRGDQNFGQRRHWLSDDEFQLLAKEAANLAAPVLTAPSTEAETEGCLIVDPSGNVLQPEGTRYLRLGNCLEEPLDQIWAKVPMQSKVIDNKLWLSVLD